MTKTTEKPAFKTGGLYQRDLNGQDTLIERTQSVEEAAAKKAAKKQTPKANKKA